MEQNRENRMKMFEIVKKSSVDDNYNAFIQNGFVIIDVGYNSHKFINVWNEYYVTMFVLSDNTNILIDEIKLYFDDYFYFKENKLNTFHEREILPKCNKNGNESHSLITIVNARSDIECRLCSPNAAGHTLTTTHKCKQIHRQDSNMCAANFLLIQYGDIHMPLPAPQGDNKAIADSKVCDVKDKHGYKNKKENNSINNNNLSLEYAMSVASDHDVNSPQNNGNNKEWKNSLQFQLNMHILQQEMYLI